MDQHKAEVAAAKRERYLARRAARKAAGICVSCGRQPAREGFTLCVECGRKNNETGISIYRRLIAEHRCAACRRVMPECYYFVNCEECRERKKPYMTAYNHSKRGVPKRVEEEESKGDL